MGHKFIIATGRPFIDALRDLGDLKPHVDYIVANNGTYYAKPDGTDFSYSGQVPKEIINEVINIGKKYNCFFAIHGSKEAKRTFLGKDGLDKIDWDSKDFIEFKKFKNEFVDLNFIENWINDQNISQLSLRAEPETIKKMKKKLKVFSNIIDIHVANYVYLDVNPKNISKIIGVKNIANLFNIALENIITFGDSGNDLEMLKEAGLGIAMGNGSQEAKASANIVIGSNNTDAIGKKVLEIIND